MDKVLRVFGMGNVTVKGNNGEKFSYNDKLWMANTDDCRSEHPRPCKEKRLENGVFCERHEGQRGKPLLCTNRNLRLVTLVFSF